MSENDYLSDEDLPIEQYPEAKEKHSYRVIMYSKQEVENIERNTVKKILTSTPKDKYSTFSDSLTIKCFIYFPDCLQYFSEKQQKKKGKKTSIYFSEEVGRYLWDTWNASKDFDDRNNFLTYCFPLVDGVIFKYARHKHGLSYDEIFQNAVIKIMNAVDKFDPTRQVGTDDKGNPIFARIYTYFTMVLNYGITTITMQYGAEKIHNISYETLCNMLGFDGNSSTNAQIIYQEFLVFLDSIKNAEEFSGTNKKIILALYTHLTTKSSELHKIANNLIFTLKNECDVKIKDVTDTLEIIKNMFGPLLVMNDYQDINHSISKADFDANN